MTTENQITPNSKQETVSLKPIASNPKINWSGSILFLILGIMIGVGSMWGYQKYFSSPEQKQIADYPTPSTTDDPMADWKTYMNSNYDISFQYPGDWETLNGAVYNTLPRLVTFETKKLTNTELEMPYINFFVAYHDNIQDIDTWLSENYMGAKIVSKKNIGGNEFLLVNGGTQFQSREHILNIGQNKYLRFVFEPVEISQIDTVDNEFEQILSTFKFLGDGRARVNEIKDVVVDYLVLKGHKRETLKINNPILLGTHKDKYSVGFSDMAYTEPSEGTYLLVGLVNNTWLIPTSGDSNYCSWINSADLDEATASFMGGPSCGF